MGKLIDITGQRFGRWTVLALHPERKRYGKAGQAVAALWLCRCIDGTERLVLGANLRGGLSLSCGCLGKERLIKRSTKHGHARRGKVTRAYWSWQHLKGRCLNPNNKDYGYYGGREPPELPIAVFEEWLHDFRSFHAVAGDPQPGQTLDRIDNDRGYVPGNIRWATPLVQRANQRPRKRKSRRAKLEDIHRFAASLARAGSARAERRAAAERAAL
jgi:hypothetical protein